MTKWTAEECMKLQLASIETMVGLTNKVVEGFQRVMELNLQAANGSMVRTGEVVAKVISAQSPQEFVQLQTEFFQPMADDISEYRRQLLEIMAATRAEFEKVFDVQYTTSKGLIEGVVSNAPSDSSASLAAWQEAVKATTAFYESMQSTAKQAMEVAESSFHTATAAASQGGRRRAAQTSHAAAK